MNLAPKYLSWSNPFARNEGRCAKTEVKLRFYILLVLEQPFRTKWGSMRKNWGKIAILLVLEQPFRTKWWSIVKNGGKIAILLSPDLSWSNPFARNEGRSSKTEVKLRFYLCRTCPGATLSHEMMVDGQKLKKNCDFTCAGLVLEQRFRTKWGSIVKNWGKISILLVPDSLEQPFRTKWWSMVKNWRKIAILLVPDLSWSNPFARNEGRSSKTVRKNYEKLRFYLCRTCPGATLSHEMRVDAQKLR